MTNIQWGVGAGRLKIKSYYVEARASSESMFANISRQVSNPLILYVDRDNRSSLYFVAAYLPSRRIENISSVVKDLRGRERSKIITFKEYASPSGNLAVALKESCEFLQLLYSYNVKLTLPYMIHRGIRKFCVYGDSRDIEKYLDNLIAYYGSKNVSSREIDVPKCFELSFLRATKDVLLSSLTPRELEILWKAFYTGYLHQPKRSGGLGAVSSSVGLSKPATSIILRKALRKMLSRLLEEVA